MNRVAGHLINQTPAVQKPRSKMRGTIVFCALILAASTAAAPDDHHDHVKIKLKDGATKAIEHSLRVFLAKAEAVKKTLILKAVDKTIDKIRKWLIEPKKAAIVDKAFHNLHVPDSPKHAVAHEKVVFAAEIPKKVHVPDYYNVHGYLRK